MSFTYVLENLTHLTKSSVDVSKYILTHWLGTSSCWSTGCCCIPGLWLWKNPLPSIHSSSPWSSWKITSDLQCWYPVHGKKVDFEFCANKRALSSSSGHATEEEQETTEVQPRQQHHEQRKHWSTDHVTKIVKTSGCWCPWPSSKTEHRILSLLKNGEIKCLHSRLNIIFKQTPVNISPTRIIKVLLFSLVCCQASA